MQNSLFGKTFYTKIKVKLQQTRSHIEQDLHYGFINP
jgi:hypothetical protein